ncbi:hypothetical protein [Nocardia nova]|uniref:hypothetical protein n=1 Tax=Nocardia nova TaxID=37330 RepID=UPI0033CED835
MEEEFEGEAVAEAPAQKAVSYFAWEIEGEQVPYWSEADAAEAAHGRSVRRFEMEPLWIDADAAIPEGMHLVEL